jgi:hypothetical protein
MSDDSRLGTPPAGWRYDSKTGSTRWWDGSAWTDLARPLDPVVRTASMAQTAQMAPRAMTAVTARPATTTSRNGLANTGLVLLVIAGLAIVAGAWLGPGMAPASAVVLTYAQIGLAAGAFVLSLVGLMVAIARRTGKSGAVIGLLLSAALVGFLLFRLAATGGSSEAAALEDEMAAWAQSETGQTTHVDCPADAPEAPGAIFACQATDETGAMRLITVTVGEDALTWELAP